MGRNPRGDDPHLFQHTHFNPSLFPMKRGSSSTCVWERETAGPYLITWFFGIWQGICSKESSTLVFSLYLGPRSHETNILRHLPPHSNVCEIGQFGQTFLGKDRRESDIEGNFIPASSSTHKLKKKKAFFRILLCRERLFSPHVGISPHSYLLFREPVRAIRLVHSNRYPKKSKEIFKIVWIHHRVSTPLTRTTTAPYNSWNTGLSPSLFLISCPLLICTCCSLLQSSHIFSAAKNTIWKKTSETPCGNKTLFHSAIISAGINPNVSAPAVMSIPQPCLASRHHLSPLQEDAYFLPFPSPCTSTIAPNSPGSCRELCSSFLHLSLAFLHSEEGSWEASNQMDLKTAIVGNFHPQRCVK